MINQRCMLGRTADFHDFKAIRTLQDPVANMWRLQHAISGFHDEWGALVFVNQPDPAFVAINHLEENVVMVNVIRHRAAIGYAYVRCDITATQSSRNKIAVLHAGSTRTPGTVTEHLPHNEGRLQRP